VLFDKIPRPARQESSSRQIAPPSRSVVGSNASLRQQLDELVGTQSTVTMATSTGSYPLSAAVYQRDEFWLAFTASHWSAWSNPLQRTAMNLWRKEYVAAQDPDKSRRARPYPSSLAPPDADDRRSLINAHNDRNARSPKPYGRH